MSNTQQQLIGAAGMGLIGVNFWQHQRADVFTGGKFAGTPAAHTAWKNLALESSFVAGAALLAGASDKAATAMLCMIAALAVLYAMNNAGGTAPPPGWSGKAGGKAPAKGTGWTGPFKPGSTAPKNGGTY